MVGGGGGGESDYSVCPRPLLQFLQFFQFMSDRLRQVTQVTSGYVSLRQGTGRGARQQQKIHLVSVQQKFQLVTVQQKFQVHKYQYVGIQ